jgi:hypothetical protein
LLKKQNGELPELDMDLIDDLSGAYMSGDVTPLTMVAFAILSQLGEAYDDGRMDVMDDVESAQQTALLLIHPGVGNS